MAISNQDCGGNGLDLLHGAAFLPAWRHLPYRLSQLFLPRQCSLQVGQSLPVGGPAEIGLRCSAGPAMAIECAGCGTRRELCQIGADRVEAGRGHGAGAEHDHDDQQCSGRDDDTVLDAGGGFFTFDEVV